MDRNNIGLALSGGGIRSAALSSGVLRRLLQKSVQIDYVSCISGGNFTAASFVDWKYRHEKQDSHDWHHEYFENMRSRIGFVCDWTKPFKAVYELLVLLLLVVFVNLAVPVLVWGALSIPVAYVIDLIFGGILRVGFNCTDDVIGNGTLSSSSSTNRTIAKCGAKYDSRNHESYKATFCFVFFAIAFLACFLGKKLVSRLYNLMFFLQVVTGVILGLTILPWLLQQYSSTAPLWLDILILTISVFFWMGFPPLRSISALAIIFYTFAFVIRWRVYRVSFPVPYLETRFYTSLLIAGTILWASPYLGASSRTSIYNYLKWRLQNAFFTRESAGRYGCGGINCADFFPILSTLIRCSHCNSKDNGNALNMASLEDMSPQYISNVVAGYWRMNKEDRDKPPEAMISLSSKEIEIITEQPGAGTSGALIHPKDIELADAMTTAALVVRPPRSMDSQFEPFRELQIIVGLAISHTIQTDVHKDNRCACAFSKVLPIILQSIAGAPIIFLAVLWLATNKLSYEPHEVEQLVMTVFIVYIVVFVAIAMLPTGSEKGWFGEDIVRWCHVHLYHVRFLREFFNINNVGPKPPALISLSDLGRVEKYGLLALFKRRVKKIVAVDGSYIRGDEKYAKQIISSMELARQYLYCEFVGFDCRDVIGEIQKKYVGQPTERHPRSYRFIVKYFDKTENGFKEAGQGEVLLLSPRHPDKGIPFPAEDPRDMTWEEYTKDTNKDLDPNSWGTGPVLKDEEVDRLTFCCCECCHSGSTALQWVSKKLCNGFPHHSTYNQFFTPSMFSAYHREGYRACLEADIEGFLSESTNKNV